MADVAFTVRDFQAADFDTLWRIDQNCFPPGISYSRSELKLYMRRRGSFTLVAAGDLSTRNFLQSADNMARDEAPEFLASSRIAGFIVAEAGKKAVGHIITIDVVEEARRSGVGSQLLRAAENRLREAGCHAVRLETAVDNISALSFYKRQGYSVAGTWPRYYSNGTDALVFQKDLGNAG
jgi:ribosomal-protein-alanine N-acetyltransferase